MPDVTISYKGASIATMDASGAKTLNTQGKYCEGDITVQYTDPEKPTQTKSVTPSESAQTVTPDSGKVLSSVSVGAVSSTYVGSGVTRKAAATYTPGTTDQTIAAGQYLSGAQTVKGDANLVAGNIKEGVTIFSVQGTHSGGSAVNCKIFEFTSATAVANKDVTVVSGDADVAAHYAGANAMVVVRKVTNNSVRGTAIIVGTNHVFGSSTSYYMNYNGTSNAAAVTSVPLTATSGSGVSVRCNANGDIIVHCLSTNNNFGGASYIIVFTW